MKDKKQLLILMDEKLHHQFKVKCAVDGTTMADEVRKFVARFVVEEQ